MERIIDVTIKNKVASCYDARYVCGNSDYVIHFDFDDEWTEFETKTARFKCEKGYVDVVFSGDVCAVPVITDIDLFSVGVYAGNIHTTTPAYVRAYKSILCGDMGPYDPPDDVYHQIMDMLNHLAEIPAVDSTLTQAGKAADAKAVGDAISTLSEDITSQVSTHNTGTDTHSDIRLLISGLTDRLNALADSDDTTLDQMSEVVAYIKANRDLISSITTDKVSVADVIDNLTTNVANKPLSAAQGVALKALIDAISIPDKLPNPNALTFTGAVSGSYDGSAPLEVEIPSGGGASGDYIQNPPTASVGQTIVVKAVDESGKPTEWEPVNLPKKVRPDWNQNDSTAADYVKNRTHYEESSYTDYVLNMDGPEITGFSIPEVGGTVTVKINGVESVETVKNGTSGPLGKYTYIGTIDFDSLRRGETGWCVAAISGATFGFANPDTTITVETTVIHKIDDKFINFDGFVRTFDYHFKGYTLYKTLYNNNGAQCFLEMCDNFILPEPKSQLFGYIGEMGFSKVVDIMSSSCFVRGFILNEDGTTTVENAIFGTNTTEMEQLAADYGYTLTTNPNA